MILGNIVKLDNTHDLLSLRHKKYSAVNKCRIVFENKEPPVKRGEIRKQAKTLISSRLWTAGKQVTSE